MQQLSFLLLQWYDENARTLPWRGSDDVYKIWLSEIMLQQTRAEAVVRYYERFLNRFPDVFALADAPLDDVLKLWEGLGYYSRARNLHKAAKIVAGNGGVFPNTVEGLEKLPGVGPYVARAVGSIAYNLCVPALDGNQMRVLSRCFADERILKTPFDLEDEAMECISRERPGDYNQALMDLGSAVCTPKKPKCEICPLSPVCRACAEGDMERYPLRPAPIVKREEEKTVFLILYDGKICIRKRDERQLLGGLYEFPSADGHLNAAQMKDFLFQQGYSGLSEPEPLPAAKHVFTHLVWRMQGYLVRADEIPEGMTAVGAEGLRSRAFPSALRVYRELAQDILNQKHPEE